MGRTLIPGMLAAFLLLAGCGGGAILTGDETAARVPTFAGDEVEATATDGQAERLADLETMRLTLSDLLDQLSPDYGFETEYLRVLLAALDAEIAALSAPFVSMPHAAPIVALDTHTPERVEDELRTFSGYSHVGSEVAANSTVTNSREPWCGTGIVR